MGGAILRQVDLGCVRKLADLETVGSIPEWRLFEFALPSLSDGL